MPAIRAYSLPIVRAMREAQARERRQITVELDKVKGLMPLLMKRRNGDAWSVDERHQLIGQLHALGHLSPYLVVLALPGSVLLLPVLAWWLDRRRFRRDEDVITAPAVPPAPTFQHPPTPSPALAGGETLRAAVPPAPTFTEVPDRRT